MGRVWPSGRRSLGEGGRSGEGVFLGVQWRNARSKFGAFHVPSPRRGVSAERRWLLFPRIAALCRDAATPGFMVPMHAEKRNGGFPSTISFVAADVRRLTF